MNEPSLLDVFKAVVANRINGRDVLRLILIVVGLYLLYLEIRALFEPSGFRFDQDILRVLGAILILIGAFLIPVRKAVRNPVEAESGLSRTSDVLRLPQVRLEFRGLEIWRSVRLMVALLLAFVAQVVMFRAPDQSLTGLALWTAAIALWYPVLRLKPEAVPETAVMSQPSINWRWGLAGAFLSAVAFLAAGGNRFTPFVVIPWLFGVVLWLLAFAGWHPQPKTWWVKLQTRVRTFQLDRLRIQLSWTTLAVLAILALGAYLRFYHLNDVPREMTSDHVEKLLDINDVLQGRYSIFFPRNTGREPFQFYYTALLMRLFDLPLSHLALKIGTALAGSATLLFVFLLARELGGTEVGLWTMLLSAIARWPIALSRAGLRYPFAPLFVAATFYFLARGLKSGRRSDFIWAGFFAGVGLQGYSSFRVVPLILLILLALWLIRPGQTYQARWQLLSYSFWLTTTMLVTSIPLFRFMLDRPDLFWERILTRISTAEQPLPGDALSILGQNLYRVLLMFNYTRDEVWTVNISNWPTLSPLLAGLFGLGLITFAVRAARGDWWATFVMVAWLMLLLPSALSLAFPSENPSMARAGASVPFVFLMAAWPLAWIRREALKHWAGLGGRLTALAGLALIVGVIARADFHGYFVTFRDQYAMSATNPSEIARVVRRFVAGGVDPNSVWLKGYPYWLDLRSVAIEAFGNFDWENAVLEPDELSVVGDDVPLKGDPKLFIIHIWDRPAIAKLRELYPNGLLAYHKSPTPGKDFLTYFAPGTEDFDENTLPPPP
jgi:hypothetical protein